MHFYAFFNHFYSALLSWIMSIRSSLFALFLIERHHSQNQGSLKSDWAISKSDVPNSEFYRMTKVGTLSSYLYRYH